MAARDVSLPEIGEGVTEGELVKWLVKVGDTVAQDQPFVEMMTDKATVEVPSPIAGVVKELKAKEGDVIKVGQALIAVEAAGASAAPTASAPKAAPAPAATVARSAPAPAAAMSAAPSATPAATGASSGSNGGGGVDFYPPAAASQVLATPHTRRLAREMSVDINQLQGSGLAGRITRDDVLNVRGSGAVSAGQPSYQPQLVRSEIVGAAEERVPLRGVRKKIAENLQMAKRIIPHFTLMDEANVSDLVHVREQTKATAEKLKIKVTYLPFVMKALIATCREYPQFNASIDDDKQEIVYKKNFNIGFAADTPQGLLVPVVHNADRKSIMQISQEIQDLALRARDGKLKPEEMKGATITITNIGSVGGTYATPIINHPEVAILGMYKIQDKPVIENGELKAIKTMNFTITADHRLIDGAVAANFLKAFFSRIENPSRLMLDMA